jgi:hypothetical protein
MTTTKTAKMDAMIETRGVEQLKEMVGLLWSDHRPEAAVVRARIYARLCDLIGDDAADAVFESQG